MVSITPEVQLKSTLKPGSVYYFADASFNSSEPHYFVVINRNPTTDSVLVLLCATSQISKVRRRRSNCPPSTLVEVLPSEYCEFIKDTIFDCNDPKEYSVDSLIKLLSSGIMKTKPEMDEEIVMRLRHAACSSQLVPGKIKKILSY